jgi:hypothetical protein
MPTTSGPSLYTGPTAVRGVLEIGPQPKIGLLDISGRKVLDLRPGANDVSRLAPGVYFLHVGTRGRTPAVGRVTVLR